MWKEEADGFIGLGALALAVCAAGVAYCVALPPIALPPQATPSSPRCFDLPPMCSGAARPVCICGFYSVTCRWECAQ